MIYLKLEAEEAFEIFELLVQNKEKKISNRLRTELVDFFNDVNKTRLEMTSSWLRNQSSKIEELKKNDSK